MQHTKLHMAVISGVRKKNRISINVTASSLLLPIFFVTLKTLELGPPCKFLAFFFDDTFKGAFKNPTRCNY